MGKNVKQADWMGLYDKDNESWMVVSYTLEGKCYLLILFLIENLCILGILYTKIMLLVKNCIQFRSENQCKMISYFCVFK
jgi:hypothetical protein